jgi:hypothetical protein
MSRVSPYKLALLVVMIFIGIFVFTGSKASAINGAPSNFFPDVNPSGAHDVLAITQIVSTSEANWNTKMKAKTTLASVYVPESLVGTNINVTIIHGCDGPGLRDGNWWNGAGTNFNIDGGGFTNSKVCPGANKDINYNFTGQVTGTVVYDGLTKYYVHTFYADAYGAETGPFSLRYTNTFQLQINTPGVYVGVSIKAATCDIANYPRSCPSSALQPPYCTPTTLCNPDSYVYSSFYGSANPSSMTVDLSYGCSGGQGELLIYDLDAGDLSLGQNLGMSIDKNPGGNIATLDNNQILFLGGGNNTTVHLPVNGIPAGNPYGYPLFNLAANTRYTLGISGLSNQNAFQVLPSYFPAGPSPGCGIPSNQPPTAVWSMNCVANGASALASYTINVSDPDGDPVSLVSGNFNGNGITPWSGSIAVPYGSSGNGIVSVTDNKSPPVTAGGAGYTCPANSPPSGTLSAVCNRLDAGGFPILDITVTTSDPEGQAVSVSGTAGGRAFSGSTSFDPVGQSESGSASMTLTDSAGGTTPVGPVNYTCPANRPPAPTITASCSLIGNPNVARISFTVGNISDPDGGGTPIYDVRIVMTSGSVSGSAANISNTSTGSYNVNRPATGTVQVEMRDNQTHVYTAWLASSPAFSCPQPPPTVNCTINGTSSFELGESYTPTVKVDLTAPAGSAPLTNTTAKTDVPGAAPATQTPPSQTVTLGVTGIFNYAPYVIPVTGSFPAASHVTWTAITPDDPAFVDCPSVTVNVVTKPYFKVVNGDIVSNNTVKGWNKALTTYTGPGSVNDSSGKSGAGVQGIIVATSIVNGVMSGDMFTPSTSLKTLTFANTSSILASPANAVYGGGFGAMSFTMPIADPNAAIWIPATTTSGVKSSYRYTGSTTFSNNSVAASTRMTVDLTGDLTINGNIIYSNSGGYGSVDAIPHIKFIVRKNGAVGGNIYINPNVSRIDAEFIAENSIDTCNTGSANKNDSCGPTSTTLVVNGSLASPTLQLNRLIGTVRLSTPGDAILTGPGTYANSGNIGEIFQFTPDMFLSTPAEPPTTGIGNRYDAVTALPPLF